MYKEVEPLIPNTICEAREVEGKIISYKISPADGYKLHEITLDEPVINKETMIETGEVKKGYTTAFVTAGANYDFIANERQIYAVLNNVED